MGDAQCVPEEITKETEFMKELTSVINKFSKENGSNTPDYALAHYLRDCLLAFDKGVRLRENYYGRNASPSLGSMINPQHPTA